MAVTNLKSISAVKPTRQAGRRSRCKPRRVGLVLGAGGVCRQCAGGWATLRADNRRSCGDAARRMSDSGLSLAGPDLCGRLFPPLPQFRLGSPQLLLTAARAPRRMHPWVLASACLPPGRETTMRWRQPCGR